MSNTDQTPPVKKMWTRCNGCQDRIYNDPHDIKIHAGHCPFDLQMTIQKLTIAVFGDSRIPSAAVPTVTARIVELEQVVGDLEQAEPSLDPDSVDEDAYTDVLGITTDGVDAYAGEPDEDAADDELGVYRPAIDRPDEPTIDPVTGLVITR